MNVLILEDDPVWQTKLRLIVNDWKNCSTTLAATIDEARQILTYCTPDVVIAGVALNGQSSLIFFSDLIRTYPIVFITAYPENNHLQQSLSIANSVLLIKPFHTYSLASAIATRLDQNQTAIYQLDMFTNAIERTFSVTGKHRQKLEVPLSEIIYIEAEGNYAIIYLTSGKHSVKRTLHAILTELDASFGQIHKSFIVNFNYVNRVNLTEKYVNLNGKLIPIGRKYRQEVLNRIK